MRKTQRLGLVGLSAAALLLIGCSTEDQVEATKLTIVTTPSALDEATSMAVSEYLETQGVDVEIQQHPEHTEVFAALESDSPEEHAVIGILTAHQDPTVEERPVKIPEALDVVAQAPAELGFAATASSITSANFARKVVNAEDPETPLVAACAEQTWFHPQLAGEQMQSITDALARDGCEPTFKAVEALDAETHGQLIEQLIVEPDTVVMLRSLDPAIPDQGLATLDVETQQWLNSNVVAVSHAEVDEPLTAHVREVIDILDSEAATDLLRGYYNAQTSVSDLQYEVDDAIRYWLADADLIDPDTVINITDGSD